MGAIAISGLTSDAAFATQLDQRQTRELASQLVQAGRANEAKTVAEALLDFDPKDPTALLVLSRAERLLGDFKSAKLAGKRAFRAAEAEETKYAAALLTAQATSAGGNKLAAQFWLRRALNAAPSEALKQRAARDLGYVRGTSPVSVDLKFSIAPKSNINNGSKHDRGRFYFGSLVLEGPLSGSGQALSGIEYEAGAKLTFRLPQKGAWRTQLTTEIETRSYSLSSEAKALAPDARSSDYAFQEFSVGISGSRADKEGSGRTTLGLNVGTNWYGGNSLSHFVIVSAGRSFQVGKRSRLFFNGAVEHQSRQDSDLRSSDIGTLSATWYHRLNGGSALSVTGYIQDVGSDSEAVARETHGLNLTYVPAKPIFAQTSVELSLGVSQTDYDRGLAGPPRENTDVTAAATFIFKDVEYFGFSPTATISTRQSDSNLPQFESEELGVKLGLRSTF